MYIGIKDFINEFKDEFDSDAKATRKAKSNLKSKGDKATKEAVEEEKIEVLNEWNEKRLVGERIHKELQDKNALNPNTISEEYIKYQGTDLIDTSCNTLKNNTTYLEKKIVSNHHLLIGYSDKVVVKNSFINIEDHKVIDKIYTSSSFFTDTGFKIPATYMYPPIDNLQDCNFYHIALQLSFYMYILWTYNKKMKPGSITINHVILNNKKDRVLRTDKINVPYLRDEVKSMLKYKKLNAS